MCDVKWITKDPKIKVPETGTEMPTVETILDDNDNEYGLHPNDHDTAVVTAPIPTYPMVTAAILVTPVVAINNPIAKPATTMTTNDPIHPKVLHEMKHLGGWFNPAALEYVT